ncbi:SGNH/GDSL hydrolase family protein [Nocardia sp. alder85J]|uniref:SGNH/GDSL hydrolase family protein n=1 Tax=Nocardia sp. alder85J TaxID=2862949 RepID=UPI001CD6A2E4|nr:SGNH/GDSL hydrolase family protein [Nocardia sp. alder85J]MCX4094638.1 SGNH/GDSL hydrolase family protein [Nocardia sp. alder85J]
MRSLTAALLAAVCIVALPATAEAADDAGKTVVVMGDSYTATAPLLGQADDGCMRSTTSWPNQLAANLGSRSTAAILDTSCNGGTIDTGDGWTLLHQARKAAATASFGPATRAVLIQLGMNDTWGASTGRAFPSVDCLLDIVRGCGLEAADENRLPDYRAVTGAVYADRIREVVDYVRYYAPAAAVVLVGYPEVFSPGQSAACMDLAAGRVVQPRAEGYLTYLDRLQQAGHDAAGLLGIRFLDVRAITAGHGSCTAESWISGLTAADSPFAGAPVHPNAAGNAAVAVAVEQSLGL